MWHGAGLSTKPTEKSPMGAIFCIPSNAERVLKVDIATDEVRAIGPSFKEGQNKWYGGIVGKDGAIYGMYIISFLHFFSFLPQYHLLILLPFSNRYSIHCNRCFENKSRNRGSRSARKFSTWWLEMACKFKLNVLMIHEFNIKFFLTVGLSSNQLYRVD